MISKFKCKLGVLKHMIISKKLCAKYQNPIVMSDYETVKYIKRNKCSVSRYGDGELNLMIGESINFQQASKDIKEDLISIVNSKNEKLLVCAPNIFYKKKELLDFFSTKSYQWICWYFKRRKGYWNYFFGGKQWGDTNLSRFYMDRVGKRDATKYIEKLKQIWDKENVVFIEGEKSKLGVGNDLFNNANSVKRIIGPSRQAYDKKQEIIDFVKDNVNKDSLLILALGPTATILASDLCKEGYWAIDLGHVDIEYEWYKMGATSKVSIASKDTAEVEINVSESLNLNQYRREIIGEIL